MVKTPPLPKPLSHLGQYQSGDKGDGYGAQRGQ